MTQSPASKQRYADRLHRRVRRDKAAIALLPWFLTHLVCGSVLDRRGPACQAAVETADLLIAELDRTAKDKESQDEGATDG